MIFVVDYNVFNDFFILLTSSFNKISSGFASLLGSNNIVYILRLKLKG